MSQKRHRDIPTTPAGIAGGQGRTPQDVEDSTVAGGIAVLALIAILIVVAALSLCGGH